MFDRHKETILKEIFEAVQRLERRQNIDFVELETKLLRVQAKLNRQEKLLEQILADLGPEAQSATLTIVDSQGEPLVPANIVVGQTAMAVFTEFDGPAGTGNVVAPVGTVTFASDNNAVATVDSIGLVTGVSAGTANITGSDSGNSLTASDSVTVASGGGVAQSATLVITANPLPAALRRK